MDFKINPKAMQQVALDDHASIAALRAATLEVRAFGSALCIRDVGSRSTNNTAAIAHRAGFRTRPAGELLGQVGWLVACYGP